MGLAGKMNREKGRKGKTNAESKVPVHPGQTKKGWLLPAQTWGLGCGGPALWQVSLPHPPPLLALSPQLEAAQSCQTSQSPLPSATVPTLTFRLWWQLLPLMTWPPPACGVQGAGNREVEAPHSTLRSFSPAPPYPEIQGLLGDTWAGGGRGWDGEHPKQPLFLTAPSPAGKPDK